MIQVEIEQMAGSPRMGTAEWLPVTNLDQALRIATKLFGDWWVDVQPNNGFGWLLTIDAATIERFVVQVLLPYGELIIGGTDQGYRIRIDAP